MRLKAVNEVLGLEERPIEFSSNGFLTVTYLGKFDNGIKFRLIGSDPSVKYEGHSFIYVGPKLDGEHFAEYEKKEMAGMVLLELVKGKNYIQDLESFVNKLKNISPKIEFKPVVEKYEVFSLTDHDELLERLWR